MEQKVRDQFEELAKPLIEFLKQNFNPHSKIIIDRESAEIVEGCCYININYPFDKLETDFS